MNSIYKRSAEPAPMVSVVMIAYNQEKLIERGIKGVVNQQRPWPVELVVVDDNSTDGTYDVARRMQERYPDVVRVFRNPVNLGLQKNYLEAFRHCRGRYLAMCDADDYWCSRKKLRRQVEYMESHPECALTFHRVINHYAGTGQKSLSNPGQPSDTDIQALSRSNFITNCSVVYRREKVDLENLPEWITDGWPDYPLHMLYASHGTIHYFHQPMAVYRQGGKGAWTAAGAYGQLRKAITVRRHMLDYFSGEGIESAGKELAGKVREGLLQAMKGIYAGMATYAPDEEMRGEVRRIMHETYALTDSDIDALISQRKKGKPLSRRILTAIRKAVTTLIPLPKP